MKHKNSYVKKCIAGVLTIALAAGVCQSYGSIEASAQEMTLPGIQQLVQEKQTQGETFHILEIVADKSNASIGYLIGGEEPVSEGRKLSELPAASERNKTMQELQSQVGTENFKDLIGNGPVSRLDRYQEGSGSRTEDIRGSFVARGTKGRYNYVTGGSAYRMLQDTEDPKGQTRYDRKSTVEATNDTNAVMQGVIPTFTKWTSATMVMRVENGTEVTEAYAADRYILQYYDGEDGSMNITNPADFAPDKYIGHKVYAEQVSGSITSYTYLGTIVKGDESSASVENSENASGVTRSLSDNDPAAATASGNDPGSGTSANLYVYNSSTASSVLWAKKVGETYTFKPITDGKFLHFDKYANGEYYVSKVSCVSDADFRLSDVYTENSAGRYVKFEAVLKVLDEELGGLGIGSWTKPNGGYFISFDAMDGCAKAIAAKCKEAGVTLTGAGATFPYKKDPKDSNIRIAPSFPTPEEMAMATDLFVLCVKMVSVDKLLENK